MHVLHGLGLSEFTLRREDEGPADQEGQEGWGPCAKIIRFEGPLGAFFAPGLSQTGVTTPFPRSAGLGCGRRTPLARLFLDIPG